MNQPLVFLGYRLKGPPLSGSPSMPPQVREICSVSSCNRGDPEGAALSWNGLNNAYCYNTLSDALKVLPAAASPAFEVFAYRLLPVLFARGTAERSLDFPRLFGCEATDFPAEREHGLVRLGFDAVSIVPFKPATQQHAACLAMLDHSPLSCNGLALDHPVNQYCLLDDVRDAVAAATTFSADEPEPGPYLVVEVFRRQGLKAE